MIRQMSSGGATGSPEMVLDVQSITIAGRRYLVSTDDVVLDSDTGVGKNKRTAEAVGGGAVLGGIIGAIAGGGKGAAIGVLVGGAGGAGAQVLTRGHDVQVPAETLLTFRLDKPVMLQADQ
jgi:outer membrane lipoprotein SlyB